MTNKELNGHANMKKIITKFLRKRGGRMARKRREMGLIEVINKWLSDFGDKLLGKEKPKPKKKRKPKRKVSKKKS